MWARRSAAVLIGFAMLLAPAASWATSRPATRTTAAAAPPIAAALPLRRAVDTTGVRQAERAGACGDAANATSIAVRPAADGTVHAQTSGSTAQFDPVLVLRDERGRVVACNDDESANTVEAALNAVVRRGARYVLEVAGQAGSTGRTQLHADLSRPRTPQPLSGTAGVRGIVTSRYDGKRIHGVCVVAFDQLDDEIASTVTTQTGAYRLDGLPPTRVRIGFLICPGNTSAYQDQYWKNAPSLNRADSIQLHNGRVTSHIDARLAPWGNITGTVYDATGKHPLAGICIDAQSALYGAVFHSVTSVTGTYRVQIVSPVTQEYGVNITTADWYTVSFHDCGTRIAADEWWNGTPGGTANPHTAVPIHLDVGQAIAGINANLHPGGAISGAIRDLATGVGVPGACVRATARNRATKFAGADISGRYRMSGLAPGVYTVFFADCAHKKLSSLYWHNTGDPATAAPVAVVSNQTVFGINANLPKRGTIAGTVVDQKSGKPIADVCVELSGTDPASTHTDYRGKFVLQRLSVGPYLVRIRDCAWYPRKFAYLPTYYSLALDAAHATPVVVHAASKATITVAMLRSGGIAGVVRQKLSQKPIVGSCVEILDPQTGSTVAEMRSSVTGAYRLAVPPGSYVVRFSSCAGGIFTTQYYNGSPDRAHATKVMVGASKDVSGIDGALSRGGAISGQILDPYGYWPYFEVCAQARVGKSPGRVVAQARSDYRGIYEIGGLPAGHYHVEFGHCHGELDYYAPTFYYNSPTYDVSSPVAVGTNEVVTGIDGRLAYGGAIQGQLRDAKTGLPANGVCVEAISNDPDEIPQLSQTYYDGSYYLYNLPAGGYHLRFGNQPVNNDYYYDCEQADVAISWYPKAIDEASSKVVTLGFNQYLSGINGFVFQSAQVTGFVTSAATGLPIAAPCAQAYGSSGAVTGRAETVAPGIYIVSGLPPDTYRVGIKNCGDKPYIPQFYDGASTIDTATPIPLAIGEVRSDIGAALVPRGP